MIGLWRFFSIFVHLLLIYNLKQSEHMKEATQQYSDITYNTFADVIDWDDLTEKDYQTIQELKENGITITPDTVIEDLSGFPLVKLLIK